MSAELWTLIGSAAFLGGFHTIVGPDHYLPFIVMAKARNWSVLRTTVITILCGIGHVASSIILGFVGIVFGIAVAKLEWFEGSRGDIAAWMLTAFGFVYCVWGIHRAIRNRPHTHHHIHEGEEHSHTHNHHDAHAHVHDKPAKRNLTPWVLFTVFVFGPCEPLIPLLMYPAATKSTWGVIIVAGVFATVTILTMTAAVLAATFGLKFLPTNRLERYTHALAGASICLCGVLIHLGL